MTHCIDITQKIRDGADGSDAGLYVFIHHNPAAVDLWDAPKGKKGKMIAGAGQHLMKSGKYVGNGLKNRLKSYHLWCHPSQSRPAESIFVSYVIAAYMLPLDNSPLPGGCNPANAFEPIWNAAWQKWAADSGLLAATQNRRSEYRRLTKPTDEQLEALKSTGEDTAKMIFRMIGAMEGGSRSISGGSVV